MTNISCIILKKSFYGEIIRRVLSASKYSFLCCCIKLTLTFILLLSQNIYCDAQWSILCTIINLISLIFFRSSIKSIGLFLTNRQSQLIWMQNYPSYIVSPLARLLGNICNNFSTLILTTILGKIDGISITS